MQQLIELAEVLTRSQRKIATVESCTGGGVAQKITDQAGASAWFERGYVTYSNAAKIEAVGVPAALIDAHGAVSEPVAIAMAAGGLRVSGADFCVAITGVAGPQGGSDDKPVGTVCFAWSGGDETRVVTEHFVGDRRAIREQSVAYAIAGMLDFVRQK